MSDKILKMPIPYEPMKKNRWILKFSEPFSKIQIWWLSKASRPSYNTLDETWDDMVIVLRDPIGESTSKIILDGLAKIKNSNYEINLELEMLDPTGVVIEKWNVNGIIAKVNFGELDYIMDESVDITMTLNVISASLV